MNKSSTPTYLLRGNCYIAGQYSAPPCASVLRAAIVHVLRDLATCRTEYFGTRCTHELRRPA